MLVLSRKIGESIQVGNDVTVEVLEVVGGRVRLGITAPRSVDVHRSEIVLNLSADANARSSMRPITPIPHLRAPVQVGT